MEWETADHSFSGVPEQSCLSGYTYEVGQKAPALHVLMSEIDPSSAATYGQNAMTFFNQYLTQSIPHTKKVRLLDSQTLLFVNA